ncbi:MAG: dicarboxylate/amino acid:cation symporter [Deltaproteobacteria bacterium]|nr:dicarboxylate/amino acid:cation symporter [Deltaproteobacteria bacterium]
MAEQASGKKGFLSWYFGANLLVRIMIGLILGAIVGVALAFSAPETGQAFIKYTKFFGDLFINLLKMIVVPVIFLSLIAGGASIAPAQLGRVGVKTLCYYLGMTIVAVTIGLVMSTILSPGEGLGILGAEGAQGKAAKAPGFDQVLLAIVPTNPIASLAKGDVLPIIFFALIFGIALSFLKESANATLRRQAETLFDIVSAGAEVMYKIVHGIMQYAPIGVFVLIAIVFAQQGPRVIGPLVFVTALVYICLIMHIFIGYGGIMAVFGLNLFTFLKGAQEAMITAFVTRSSSATLPISLQVSEEKLGVPRSISSFALPIGATVNMEGTAIYLSVCATFIANAVGQPLTFDQQLTILITGTLGAIGAAGVPGAGAIMMLMVLESIGLKVEAGSAVAAAYAMILGIDALLDMGRTCMNVTGDINGVVIVSKSEGVLDLSKWKRA